jgi:site-specific DNA recombinase
MSSGSLPTPETKRVGIWLRVSTEDQARGESPEHHEKRARYYAEAKGWKVCEVYHLEAVSGKAVMAHPEAQRMLAHIRSGHITGLIFSKLARLARNTRELLDFSDIFREHGADLISLQEAIDTTSPAGRLFYTMIAAMAQWEREEIAERVAVSVPIRAKLGKCLGGQASFGYQWLGGKLIPHPDEAPVRRLIYELFAEHRRKKTVARILNERGYRTRNGSYFTDTSVGRLIRDPTAMGIRRANHTKLSADKKTCIRKPASEWVEHPVDAIVSEELWRTCNALLDDRRAGKRPPAKKPVHLFAGIAYCTCGRPMYVPSNTPKYVCQGCRNKMPIVDLEAVFHEQLKRLFFSPSEIAEHLRQADETLRAKEELIGVLEAEQRKLAAEMDRIYRLYIDDEIPKDGFGQRYRPLDDRYKQIEDELPKLQAELDVLRIHHLSSEEIIAEARDLYARWPDLPLDEKRHIVEAITERIVVGQNEIDINLLYLPPIANDGKMATPSQRFVIRWTWMSTEIAGLP